MSWEKKHRCLWLLDKLKRENTLTLEGYECLTSVKAKLNEAVMGKITV